MATVKKAIIPVAGLGTRFLPLSKAVPKELWPLVDKPVIQYIVEEAKASGIKEIIFVTRPKRDLVFDYFENKLRTKRVSKAKYRNHFQEDLKKLEKLTKGISFSRVFQKNPLGDGHALLQAKDLVKKEPCAVLWADDVVESKTPCLLQLIKVFEECKKSVLGLARVPKESFQFYGMIEGNKTKGRTYKIKRIAEKPEPKDSPSNLAVVGRYILTPDVFNFLEKADYNQRGEIVLDEVLSEKLKDGLEVCGCEFEGKWLECGNKSAYLKSNLYLALKHPRFGKELKESLRTWRNRQTR